MDAVIFGLEHQARALTAQTQEQEHIRFLVGSLTLRHENQIHLVTFNDDENRVDCSYYPHPAGEVWDISSCPTDPSIFATCYSKPTETSANVQAAIWKMPDEDAGPDHNLTELFNLDECQASLKCVLWNPSGESDKLVSVDVDTVRVWDLKAGVTSATLKSAIANPNKGASKFSKGRWNPHHNSSQVAVAMETSIKGWDLRTQKVAYTIDQAHGQFVRDMDFNPNKQYYLLSGGDDCKIKFWDIRNCSEPVRVQSDHSHWVWNVRYNHFHDQLILSSSSDSRVILSSVMTLSSDPGGRGYESEDPSASPATAKKQKEATVDRVVHVYEEHEDSVYAVEWSSADPWVFASLSHDGRLVINRVPREEKYKILEVM
eukprot:Colp12_sorted_trinity150504_noHs@22635